MEQEPTLASQNIRHLGLFRTGLTRSDALLDKAILKSLFRRWYHYGVAEGILAGYCATRKDDPKFQAAIARLHEWKLVDFGPSPHQDTRTVLLTRGGKDWAMELISYVQTGKETE